jgi:hypothetical protein
MIQALITYELSGLEILSPSIQWLVPLKFQAWPNWPAVTSPLVQLLR